jgi:HSP20 family molecular chaperone IbpA
MFGLTPYGRNWVGEMMPLDEPILRRMRDLEALLDVLRGEPEVIPVPPGMEIEAEEKEVVVRIEAPGFEPKDFELRVAEDKLIVTAKHEEERGEKKAKRVLRLEKALLLPEGIDVDKAVATFRNGVLEVRLPRVPEAAPKMIEVKA